MNEVVVKIIIAVSVLATIGGILGFIIALCSKIFYVKPDQRKEKILPLLPGANCGACGYAGCSALAQAIIDDFSAVNNCRPLKKERAEEIKFVMEEFNRINIEIEQNLKKK